MPATKRPTPQDAATARRILLDGLSQEYVTRERRLLDPDDYALAVDDEFAMGEARRTACSGAVFLLSLVAASQCLAERWRGLGFVFAHVSTWAGRWPYRVVSQRYAASGRASPAT